MDREHWKNEHKHVCDQSLAEEADEVLPGQVSIQEADLSVVAAADGTFSQRMSYLVDGTGVANIRLSGSFCYKVT